jgi:CRP/FNR family transcriptional regulator
MNRILDIISNVPLFKGLSKDQLVALSNIAVEKNFIKGKTIFLEGNEGRGFFIVCSGLVKIYKTSTEGKEKILEVIKPYEIFAPVPVFSGETYPASAETMKSAKVIFFSRDDFLRLVGKYPDIALNMLAAVSDRLRQFTVQIENLSLKETPSRLAAYFLHILNEKSGDNSFTLEIPKGQLASLLGTIPETLSRILAKMRETGIIGQDGKNIKVLDRDSLQELAKGAKLFK